MDAPVAFALGFFIGGLLFAIPWRAAVEAGRADRAAIRGYHKARRQLEERDVVIRRG
uniref:Uncharacterized protein n=1 Tax=viral metagenome TaxID=1070528 RepID=A0A6M3L3H6_9ZZZZ